jgi:hypothetical protein
MFSHGSRNCFIYKLIKTTVCLIAGLIGDFEGKKTLIEAYIADNNGDK